MNRIDVTAPDRMITLHVLTSPADASAHGRDDYRMQQALVQAKFAWRQDEVPVSAVVVCGNEVVGVGYNALTGTYDLSVHAKMRALRQTTEKFSNYHLPDCEVFVTLELCVMCAGTMLYARVACAIHGVPGPKTGTAGSILDLSTGTWLSHQTAITGNVPAQECDGMLRAFFAEYRAAQKATRLAATEPDESAT